MTTSYRSDKSNVVLSSEPYPKAYCQNVKLPTNRGTTQTGMAALTVGQDKLAGITQPTPALVVNDCILISGTQNTGTVGEVRKIIAIEGTDITLNAPLSLYMSAPRILKVDSSNAGDIVDASDRDQPGFLPGAYDNVNLSDPNNTYNPQYGMNLNNNREFAIAFRGLQTFEANIPGVALLSGRILRNLLGDAVTYPAAQLIDITPGTQDLSKGTIVLNRANPAADSFVFVGQPKTGSIPTNAALDEATAATLEYGEVRRVARVTSSKVYLDAPLTRDFGSTAKVYSFTKDDSTFFYHDIRSKDSLPSMSLSVTHRPAEQDSDDMDFNRKLIGGKIASMTLQAAEDRFLSSDVSFVFCDAVHNQGEDVPGFCRIPSISVGSGGNADSELFAGQELFYFVRGEFSFEDRNSDEKHLLTVRSVNLQVDNGIEPRYYARPRESDRFNPVFLSEQKKTFNLGMTLTLPIESSGDQRAVLDYFKDLQRFDSRGTMITLLFRLQDSDSYIRMKIPGDVSDRMNLDQNINTQGALLTSAPHIVGGADPLEIEVSYLVRGMSILVKDKVALDF